MLGEHFYGSHSGVMSQSEADEKQRWMREDAMRGSHFRDPASLAMGPEVEKMPVLNISINVERVDKVLAYQEELLTILEQKLTPFIRPYPKQTREERNSTASCQSALSERLNNQALRGEFLNFRINAIIESIDL